jgi:hypothetical protein
MRKNKFIWTVELQYFRAGFVGRTVWEFDCCCPMEHDAHAIANLMNKRFIPGHGAYVKARVRKYRAVPFRNANDRS